MTPPSPIEVSLRNAAFSPARVTASVGQTVHWTNDDTVTHTVTSGTGSSDTAAGLHFDHTLNPGESFSFRIDQAASVPYFCRIHEAMGMKGTIAVATPYPPPY